MKTLILTSTALVNNSISSPFIGPGVPPCPREAITLTLSPLTLSHPGREN